MVTKTQLRAKVAFLRKQGVDITIQWAYGRPRCYTADEARELSPRLSTGQMALWLDGFEAGMRAPKSLEERVNDKMQALAHHLHKAVQS